MSVLHHRFLSPAAFYYAYLRAFSVPVDYALLYNTLDEAKSLLGGKTVTDAEVHKTVDTLFALHLEKEHHHERVLQQSSREQLHSAVLRCIEHSTREASTQTD